MKLLGRATSISAYVKRGEESGYIRITLRGNGKQEHITITRKINSHNKSEWLFNGKVSTFLITNQRLYLIFYYVLLSYIIMLKKPSVLENLNYISVIIMIVTLIYI